MHEDERPLDSERTALRTSISARPPPADEERSPDSERTELRRPISARPPLADEETAATDGDDGFARRTGEMAIADLLRPAAPRPVLPFVQTASPPAIATPTPRPSARHAEPEDFTGEMNVRDSLRSAMPFVAVRDEAVPAEYDPQTAKPVLPFRAAQAPAIHAGPPISPVPRTLPDQSGETLEIRTRPRAPLPSPPPPSPPASSPGAGQDVGYSLPLRFPPAPPLGPTPGRFVTPTTASPPPGPVAPRAPTFGGPPPPSSPGAAIPRLPPIPGKPTRS